MSKKNIFIFASDERSHREIVNVVFEIKKRDTFNYFYLYSNTVSPCFDVSNYNFDSNVEYKQEFLLKTFNFNLPFKPDIFLTTRDAWEPETSIIQELKIKDCIVCCVENSSWLYNNISTRLEILSRFQFPKNLIDAYFDHSQHTFKTKVDGGFIKHKTKITGNPKYDNIINSPITSAVGNKSVIFYGSCETNMRPKIIEKLNLVNSKTDVKIYYRPHPSEFAKFKDFPNVELILLEEDLIKKIKECDFHVSIFSSVIYYPLIMNKNVVIIDSKESGLMTDFALESWNTAGRFDFWSKILKIKTWDEFCEKIDPNKIKAFYNNINKLYDYIKLNMIAFDDTLYWLDSKFNENQKNVLALFDEFNDGKASNRIVDEIENLYD
jgi:hypothetical protein